MPAGQPLGNGSSDDPQEMNSIRKDYSAELSTTFRPATSFIYCQAGISETATGLNFPISGRFTGMSQKPNNPSRTS